MFVKQTLLACDGCDSKFGLDECGMAYTAKKLRADAKRIEGWRKTRDGRDRCPACIEQYQSQPKKGR